jgi:hypothetical protein
MNRLILIAFVWLASCRSPEQEKVKKNLAPQRLSVSVPVFDGDSALLFCKRQVAFGPRVPGTQSHLACGDFIVETMKRLGADVIEQEFEAVLYNQNTVKGRNIFASLNPQAKKRVLLAAHWDTRPYADQDEERNHNVPIEGANDGASGVSILMEVAAAIKRSKTLPTVGLDFIFFDVEDYGEPEFSNSRSEKVNYCLGSQHWGQYRHDPNYRAYYGILFDMVGGQEAQFYFEANSYQIAPSICELVWTTAENLGYGTVFVRKKSHLEITDDHIFVSKLAGIPMIDIIEHGLPSGKTFFNHWHKVSDTFDKLSPQTLKAVGQTTLAVVYSEPI